MVVANTFWPTLKKTKMNPIIEINQRVSVIAVCHAGGQTAEICTPVRMRYKGHDITFSELGMRHPTTAGKRMIHVFDVSDGINDYRLAFDAESLAWTLVSMLEGHQADKP